MAKVVQLVAALCVVLAPPTGSWASWSDTDSDTYNDLWTDPVTSVTTTLADMNLAGSDVDQDGATNDEEAAANSDPYDIDTDEDALLDGDELHLTGTSPTNWDSNGDFVSDYDAWHNFFDVVYENGQLPSFQNASYSDYDGDGMKNPEDPYPTDPLNSDGDADDDGINDSEDPAPNDATNYSSVNGTAWNGAALDDDDQDGTVNFHDPYPSDPFDNLPDFDEDGLLNGGDPFPRDLKNYSSINGVAWGTEVMGDADGDLILNWEDTHPQDPYNGNPDFDSDNIANEQDPFPTDASNYSAINETPWYGEVLGDADNDAILNWEDEEPTDPQDTDSDGITDYLDPYPNDATNYSSINETAWGAAVLGDIDEDGVANYADAWPEDYWNGQVPDTDFDGYRDDVDPAINDPNNYSPHNELEWFDEVFGDDDNDGIFNWDDAHPDISYLVDRDADGFNNTTDPYPDDATNYSPINETAWGSEVLGNADGDGLYNYEDPIPLPVDEDGDGLWLVQEELYGTSDEDVDCDDDGLSDAEEKVIYQTDPLDAYSVSQDNGWGELYTDYELVDLTDTDDDGLPDRIEAHYGLSPTDPADASGDLDGNGLSNLTQYGMGIALNADLDLYDADGDGMSDIFEDYYGLGKFTFSDAMGDEDGDGVLNYEEQVLVLSPLEADTTERGGLGDLLYLMESVLYPSGGAPTTDTDEDGTPDWAETALLAFNPAFARQRASDMDGDGMPDVWEHLHGRWHYPNLGMYVRQDDGYDDADGDGLTNFQEYQLGTNPLISDSDSNGTTDDDEDSDEDGLTDAQELSLGLDPLSSDTDQDGMSDGYETAHNLDALDPYDAYDDPDADYVFNVEEADRVSEGLDPQVTDSDANSGNGDDFEAAFGFASSTLDLNRVDIDSDEREFNDDWDGDEFVNLVEVLAGTDPRDGESHPEWTGGTGGSGALANADPSSPGGTSGGSTADESFYQALDPGEGEPPEEEDPEGPIPLPELEVEAQWYLHISAKEYWYNSETHALVWGPDTPIVNDASDFTPRGSLSLSLPPESENPPAWEPSTGASWCAGGHGCTGTSACVCTQEGGSCLCHGDIYGSSPSSGSYITLASAFGAVRARFAEPVPVFVKVGWLTTDGGYEETWVTPGSTEAGQHGVYPGRGEEKYAYCLGIVWREDLEEPDPPQGLPQPAYSVSGSDAAGPKFRRIGMDGMPMRDGFPDPEDASKERQSATYVDAYSRNLRHSMSDAAARRAPGAQVNLEARRDYGEEVWSNASGLSFSERPDRPFGAGFSTNLCPTVTVQRVQGVAEVDGQTVPIELYGYTATVVDEQGAGQTFKWLRHLNQWVHIKEERSDFITSRNTLTSSWDEYDHPHSFVLTKYTGGSCVYEMTEMEQAFPSDRQRAKGMPMTVRYGRLVSATDRRGQEFSYDYATAHSLVPTSIESSLGGTLSITLNSEGLITSVSSDSDTPTTYAYTSVNGVPVLQSSTKDGRSTSYAFATWNEDDPTPPVAQPGDAAAYPEVKTHVYLTGVTEPGGNAYSFTTAQDLNHTYEQWFNDPETETGWAETRTQFGRPRLVASVSGPGGIGASFTGGVTSHVALGGTLQLETGTTVSGSAGTYEYEFGGAAYFVAPSDPDEVECNEFATAVVCTFDEMTISSAVGEMKFEFDTGNGNNLVKFTGLNGLETTWAYELGEDRPQSQSNGLITTSFGYDAYRDLIEVVDGRGVTREIVRDETTGMVRWENVKDAQGQYVYERRVIYEGDDGETLAAARVPSVEMVVDLNPADGVQHFVYAVERDANDNIISETVDPDGLALESTYVYSWRNLPLVATDPLGNSTRHAYDVRGNRIRTVHPDGSEQLWEYDGHDNVVAEIAKDSVGEETSRLTHTYDALGQKLSTTVEMGEGEDDLTSSWTYNAFHEVASETDARGTVTTHVYEAPGVKSSTSVAGLTTSFGYGANSMRTIWDDALSVSVTDSRGVVTSQTLDAMRRVLSVSVSHGGGTTSTTYDAVGNALTVTDALGKTTSTAYDAMSRPTVVTLPDGLTRETVYNSLGKVMSVTDELGRTTDTDYDAAGRPLWVRQPTVLNPATGQMEQPVVMNAYDEAGNVVAVTDALGRVATTEYDNRNRPVKVTSPPAYDGVTGQLRQAVVTTEYDTLGRVVAKTDAFGQRTTMEYDRAGRLIKTTLPPVSLGGAAHVTLDTQAEYDANGNVLRAIDTAGRETVNEYDALNRLVETTDAEGIVTEFGYDGSGNRTSVTDGKGNVTTWTYDGMKRVLTETAPSGVLVTHEYNALNKTKTTDARGQEITFSYDPDRHWLTQVTTAAFGGVAAHTRTMTHDDAGTLLTVTESANATANVVYEYDVLGRVISETSQGVTHEHTYDLAGNRVKTDYGTGREVTMTYDALNRMSTMAEGGRTTRWHYDRAGRCVRLEQGNGLINRQTYDEMGRLTRRSMHQPYATVAMLSLKTAYDAAGNVVRQEENWLVGSGAVPAQSRVTEMGYDLNSRLTGETVTTGGSSVVETAYAYDDASNRTSKVVDAGPEAGTWSYSYNAMNQLTGFTDHGPDGVLRHTVAFTYDANGNRVTRTQDGTLTHSYAWDEFNRLKEVATGGATHAYGYDYRTRRITRSEPVGGGTTEHTGITYTGGVSVAEYEITNPELGTLNPEPETEFQRGPDMGGGVGGLLYSLRAGVAKFNLSNARGDVVAQTDSAGAITWSASYEAGGKRPVEEGSNADRQRANTKEEDPTGLLNEGFRYRDLETMVWLSRDPAGFVDGPNLYAYVRQNPWTMVDQDGLAAQHIGYVYKIIVGGEVKYVGSTTSLSARFSFSKHEHYRLLCSPGASMEISPITAQLPKFQSALSRRDINHALRAAEQPVMETYGGAKGGKLLNKINAATEDNVKTWSKQYSVKAGAFRSIAQSGAVAAGDAAAASRLSGLGRSLGRLFTGAAVGLAVAPMIQDKAQASALDLDVNGANSHYHLSLLSRAAEYLYSLPESERSKLVGFGMYREFDTIIPYYNKEDLDRRKDKVEQDTFSFDHESGAMEHVSPDRKKWYPKITEDDNDTNDEQ